LDPFGRYREALLKRDPMQQRVVGNGVSPGEVVSQGEVRVR
jgi:hypothetical protein